MAQEATAAREATVVVIGAGQAGLSAGYHLARSGFVSALDGALDHPGGSQTGGVGTFVVLDAETAAGGAWRHRWESLRMNTVNGIFDLPGYPKPEIDGNEPSREAVPRYFEGFESHFELPILRPVIVTAVTRVDAQPDGLLHIDTDGAGSWRARYLINASGTWNNPIWPHYPGAETFRGRQLHTRDYVSADEFVGQRVAVVGGGISALQQLEEISRRTTTFWYTRREPVFAEPGSTFSPEIGRHVIAQVIADVEAGRPTGSVVSYTGLSWTPYALAARERGALDRRAMFTEITPTGVREADSTFTSVDVILWATGFKPSIAHLDPLRLRNELGAIRMVDTRVADEPRVHLIGYGPSQSTVGANRSGRAAVAEIRRALRA